MNSKELLLKSMYNGEVERVPWVPFVGCHAASLIGVTAEEYFKNDKYIVNGAEKAFELYKPDGLPVTFDLQVEAEALGCKLIYSDTNPPSVASHPLAEGKKIEDLKIPTEEDGRFPIILKASREIVKRLGDRIAIYGLVTGPFTLALHLKGTDIFYQMIDEPEEIHKLMTFCQKISMNSARMYIDTGVDVIAIVDPMTSQISPSSFEEFVAPYITPIFAYIKERKKASSLFVCGNATRNIEAMCKCQPNNISIDENVDLRYAKEICHRYGISIGGNIRLTVTMLFGTPLDNIKEVENLMQIGGKKGYILSPGCDIPFNTPPENIRAIASAVYGEVAEFMKQDMKNNLEEIDIELPDYKNEKKVILDVITLDSESCAPCQYVVEAVKSAIKGIENKVEWKEYKIKEKESVARMIKLKVPNIPTICIDGEPVYISIIPSVEELRKTIERVIAEKGL
ncbi:MAG: thioredoxin family protein [bacterium]|nr:thioredoxin family protein [bacterium]